MLSPYSRTYITRGVAGTPGVLRHLLQGLDSDAKVWDFRPNPERFTLREVLAHLADYDDVSRERFQRIINEDSPELPNWDEDEAVITGNYAAADPLATLARLAASRQQLGEFLAARAEEDWARTASRPQAGRHTLEEGAILLVAHDTYHVQQVVEWLEQFNQK